MFWLGVVCWLGCIVHFVDKDAEPLFSRSVGVDCPALLHRRLDSERVPDKLAFRRVSSKRPSPLFVRCEFTSKKKP